MSEDFLKRWSRRKRDVAEAEQAKPEDSAHESAAPTGDERSIEPVEAVEPAKPPEFDLKELPPIESITAATDIRPFLAPGVPVDIARAALRRAWSADPRIRDFVGLADYDWDYHAVGGAAGFGPLEMTDELRRAVARILGGITEGDAAADAGRTVGTESTKESRVSGGEVEAAPTALPHGPDGRSFDRPGQAVPATVLAPSDTAFAVLQHEGHPGDVHRTTLRRGHGRALPK
jgi:Protein of unknown function (DUF3306)